MIIVKNDDKTVRSTKNILKSKFDKKNISLIDVILEIKVSNNFNGLILNQSHCVHKILGKFNKNETIVAGTPLDVSLYLSRK